MSPARISRPPEGVSRDVTRNIGAVPEAQRPLSVQVCELYARDNAAHHHTERFDAALNEPHTPILRRGQPFMLAVRFDRPYDASRDAVQFLFEFEKKRGTSKGLSRLIRVKESAVPLGDNDSWDAAIQRGDPRDPMQTYFQVMIPAKAKVGVWHLVVQTGRKDGGGAQRLHRCVDPIYILFNPWCKEDDVYMQGEHRRQEYVLNDSGKVWRNDRAGYPWAYGQFDEIALPCAMELLRLSGISAVDRGSPVLVSRAISKAVNSNDDSGLIVGKWAKEESEYSAGTPPFRWTGTVAIMEQFMKTKEPVKYGQCWVYAAATVTVCRALGIPCRAVTTFGAAHDGDNSLTIDRFVAKDGKESGEMLWNFHVWNDVWMARPDLPEGYGGWQAIDATPQERSKGVYQCGPAPVEAVRRGFVGLGNDTQFVFSEVNGDVFYFVDKGQPNWKSEPYYINTDAVGSLIVTKKVGKDDDYGNSDMEIITNEYKFPEGSTSEVLSKANAVRSSEYTAPREKYGKLQLGAEDVEVRLSWEEDALLGHDLPFTLHVHNKSEEQRQVSYMLQGNAVGYKGNKSAAIKRADGTITVLPGSSQTVQLVVSAMEYMSKIQEEGLLNVFAVTEVEETKQTWVKEFTAALQKPQIRVKVRGRPQVNREFIVNFFFRNPLKMPLTNCKYRLEGSGLLHPKSVALRDVKPGELVQWEEKIVPRLSGPRKLIANFYSRELAGVTGQTAVEVRRA